MPKILLYLGLTVLNLNIAFSAVVSGRISDEEGNPLPFASVFVKNSSSGVSTDFEGRYFLELPPGTYLLVYSFLGYEDIEKLIEIREKQHLIIDIKLKKNISAIGEVEIVANKTDRAKKIMSMVRQNRKYFLNKVENYKCRIYAKTSFEKEYKTENTLFAGNAKNETNELIIKKDRLNLTEYIADVFFKKPNLFKQNIIAYHNFSGEKPPGRSVSMRAGIEDNDITPKQYAAKNPYLFDIDNIISSFNFYKNLIHIPQLCNQPLKSPIAAGSLLTYRYEYIESFNENGKKIHKIKVTPLNKTDALFFGNIYIEDVSWALVAADLFINEKSLMLYKNFRIIINYENFNDDAYLPEKINIVYTAKHGKNLILGETKIKYKDYAVNQEIDKKIFNNEVKTFADNAYEKDSVFWSNNRLFALKPEELKYISKTDSLQKYYRSNEFLDKQDSIFNRLYWYTPLAGWGRKNHYKGTEFRTGGILEQIVPFGIGGYRHKLPLYFNKEFKNGMLLETTESIDYGFNNNDLKGKLGIGLTYYPKKFIRTFIDVGNTYELINNYASLEQIFSRSNYVNTKSIRIRQRIEIVNGLFAEFTFLYSDQNSINNLKLSKWSEYVFGELNEPIDFERYIKSEIKLTFKYRINQKYIIDRNKKIITGMDYPEINFTYRKGIPDIFGSEVNFKYIEAGAKAEHKLAGFGSFRWQVSAGIFTDKSNLRVLEYKYFRGSDVYFFSDPLRSFQLLGPTLFTNNEFFTANYIHHFNGAVLNKIPGINFLKLSVAAGAGTISMPSEAFYHFEMFSGLEKVFRIRGDLFRFGIYAVTADNTLSNLDITLKFGISFFNSYTKKWTY